jgi:hypothetical protein
VADSGRKAESRATLEPGTPDLRVDLQFGDGLTLSGTAVRGEAPLPGVAIIAEGQELDHSGYTQTDARGRFSIDGLAAGSYRVTVRDFTSGLAHDETVDLATSREIVLEVPTASVSGRVIDAADRQPLAGVQLALEPSGGPGPGAMPALTGVTDLDGRFRIESVGDGDWRLTSSKKGYAAGTRTLTVRQGSGIDGVELELDATEGLVLETRLPNGTAPGEVAVAVLDPTGGALVSGNYATGENGRVRLSSVPSGSWDLVVEAGGSASTAVRAQAPGPPVPVALPPACGLRVHVPDLEAPDSIGWVRIGAADGRPYRDLGWNGQPRSEWRMTGGERAFDSLPPGAWTVTVTAPDGRRWTGSVSTTPGAPAILALE